MGKEQKMNVGRYQSSITFDTPDAQPAQQTVPVAVLLANNIGRTYLPLTMLNLASGW
ncbi:MAG: hypothetical protein M1337_08435 [Actinobacteria bacterium]|nr:hypothetical protein [Actinomycetota bacterium]